jgi:hypothetical protein
VASLQREPRLTTLADLVYIKLHYCLQVLATFITQYPKGKDFYKIEKRSKKNNQLESFVQILINASSTR